LGGHVGVREQILELLDLFVDGFSRVVSRR
jgi:hypothetical protein